MAQRGLKHQCLSKVSAND